MHKILYCTLPGQEHPTCMKTKLNMNYTYLNIVLTRRPFLYYLTVVFGCHVCHIVPACLVLDQSSSCCHASSTHYGLRDRPLWVQQLVIAKHLTVDTEAKQTNGRKRCGNEGATSSRNLPTSFRISATSLGRIVSQKSAGPPDYWVSGIHLTSTSWHCSPDQLCNMVHRLNGIGTNLHSPLQPSKENFTDHPCSICRER